MNPLAKSSTHFSEWMIIGWLGDWASLTFSKSDPLFSRVEKRTYNSNSNGIIIL